MQYDQSLIAFNSIIDQHFKWGQSPPIFCSVFTGSNDRGAVGNLTRLKTYLNIVEAREGDIVLLSVIGGMFFLDLFEHLRFSEISLFDLNIAEHAKFALCASVLSKTTYEEFDGFKKLDDNIRSDPTSFYCPSGAGSLLNLKLTGDARFGIGSNVTSMETLLSPNHYDDFVWKPSKAAYDSVVRHLRSGAFSQDIHFNIPSLSRPGKIVLVYLSNAMSDLPPERVRGLVKGTMVLPIYASDNAHFEEAHWWWQFVAERLSQGSMFQLWAPEDAKYVDSNSCLIGDFVNKEYSSRKNCILFHIIFGKNQNAQLVNARKEVFESALRKATEITDRIIIAEFSKSGTSHSNHDALLNDGELAALCSTNLNGFHLKEVRYSPGFGDERRNVFHLWCRF